MFALASLMVSAPMIANAQEPKVMEIVTFQAQPDVTDEAITTALEPIEEKMGQYGTLVGRSVAEGPDGTWTMVNFWTDRDAMNRINKEALTWPEFGALPAVANLETLQMQQLDIQAAIGLGGE